MNTAALARELMRIARRERSLHGMFALGDRDCAIIEQAATAIATEAATAAETTKIGSVHEGAGAKHIAHHLPPYPSTD